MANDLSNLFGFFKSQATDSTFVEELYAGESIEDNVIVTASGNISVGFRLSLPDPDMFSASDMEEFNERLSAIIKRLPLGTVIHRQDQYDYGYPEAIQRVTTEGIVTKKMKDHYGDNNVLFSRTLLYLCFNTSGKGIKNPLTTGFASYKSRLNGSRMQNLFADLRGKKTMVENVAASFKNDIESLQGVKATRMTTESLQDEMYRYHNLEFLKGGTHYKVAHENVGSKLEIGSKQLRFVSLSAIGDNIYIDVLTKRSTVAPMTHVFGHALSVPHVVNTAIWVADTEKELGIIDSTRKLSQSIGKYAEQNGAIKAAELEKFTASVRQNNAHLAMLDHNVMFWSDQPAELPSITDAIHNTYSSMNNSKALSENYDSALFYSTYRPGYASEMFRCHTMPVEQAACFMNFTSPSSSDRKGIMFMNRERQPILMDLHADFLPGKNRIIIGGTGSGKSFTVNAILSQLIELGHIVIIIDVGGSYKNLIQLHQGKSKYLEATETNPFRSNPFLVNKSVSGFYSLNPDKKIFLLTLLNTLWKAPSDGVVMSKQEEAVLSEFLDLYYAQVNDRREIPRLDGFVNFVVNHVESNKDDTEFKKMLRFFDIDDFQLTLRDYTEGTYSHILNADDEISISQYKLVAFDMAGIKDNKKVYPVVALMIMELINDQIKTFPEIYKEVIIDEAWSMLGDKLGEYFDMLVRTIRKNAGSLNIISQGVVELMKAGAIGESIRMNSHTRILLQHKNDDFPLLQKFFNYTDHQIKVLGGIQKDRNGREIFIQRDTIFQVVRIEVGRWLAILYSSHSGDRTKLQRLYARFSNMEQSVDQFYEDDVNAITNKLVSSH